MSISTLQEKLNISELLCKMRCFLEHAGHVGASASLATHLRLKALHFMPSGARGDT